MAATHTPGPWVTNGETLFAGDIDKGESIAELYVQSQWAGGTREGNANLIAAAPELRTALESIRMQTLLDCEACRHVWKLANDALEALNS